MCRGVEGDPHYASGDATETDQGGDEKLSSIIAEDGTRGVQELEEDTLSRYDTMRGANDLEVNPLPRENTMGGVREFKEDSLSWLIPREVLKRLKKTRSRGPIQREV